MKSYIYPSLISMVRPKLNWQSGVDALNKVFDSGFGWVKNDQRFNVQAPVMRTALSQVMPNDLAQADQSVLDQIVRLYFAKFLYCHDLTLSHKSMFLFINDFFKKEI